MGFLNLLDAELNRINVSSNGKYIYVGGKNLHFLKKIQDQHTGKITYALLSNKSIGKNLDFLGANSTDCNYYNLIPTPSGHFIVFETGTNNAVLYNKNFEQIKQFTGTPD